MRTDHSTNELPASVHLREVVAPLAAEPDAVHACKILIIDDEMPNLRLLERVLARGGFESFVSTPDSREAGALFRDFQPDLVLTDWLMPGFDGCAVIEELRGLMSTDDYLPIVVLTADVTPQTRMRALTAGATDFLTKPFDQIEVLLRMRNLLQARLSHRAVQAHNATLEESVRVRTIDLERALTELRQTQQQVVQQERLAALGTMAGGIAHDFNNALSIIMGFSELLLRDAEHGLAKESATPSITTILTAAEDAAKIVHRLRDFYRPGDADEQRVSIDLNQLIEQAILLTKPRWGTQALAAGREIAVTAELGVIPAVSGDPGELREVLTNLIFNAVDALPHGGAITLQTHCTGETVAVRVNDTGTGMSEEVRRRCLEPFFTTKGQGGTGLGLAMVFGIVQRHGGSVDIGSELGKGTAFTLRLPATHERAVILAARDTTLPRPLHILVVDDQPILCHLVCKYLEDDLHEVKIATSGTQALEAFGSSDFDLVITDHVMSGMNGHQLATAIRKLNPRVPLILLTGYADHTLAQTNCPETVDLVLAKPLSRSALRHALAHVMQMKSDSLAGLEAGCRHGPAGSGSTSIPGLFSAK